jgi:4-amino-4-deoxy-L-arabinose transferase-like glycosyltransferase
MLKLVQLSSKAERCQERGCCHNAGIIIATVKAHRVEIIITAILIALIALPRLVGIDRFATIDEPYWLTAGSDFYYALGQRAFVNTFYDYHPAVTTMWIVTAAMLVYFPQYRGFGQGYFDVYKDSLERFLLSHDHTPLGLLITGRVIQTIIIVVLLLGLLWFMRKLVGGKVAVLAILLIAFDPFFLGHSRLLNHEAMLSLFVLVSLLALVCHLFFEKRLIYLIVSGAAAGFAQLTKSSSLVLFPVIGLLFLLAIFVDREATWRRRLAAGVRAAATWLALMCLVYFVFWPGMWVVPGQMLYQVFGNALSYAFEGSRLSATGGVQAAPTQLGVADIVAYGWSILWRTTPVIWLGSILGLGALLLLDFKERVALLSVLVTGSLFVVLFGVVSGRNSAHYVLTSYVSLDIIAAAGLVWAADWISNALRGVGARLVPGSVLVGAVLIQAVSALAFFPYYYIYFNPIMEAAQAGRQNPSFGYGEGLDLAAAYLNQQPDAANSTVMAFYGRGPFSFFYPGRTEQLKPVYADAENVPQLVQTLHASQYLVLYYELEKERESPANVMHALADVAPQKSIWLNDIEYIRIYRVDALPADFYARLAP